MKGVRKTAKKWGHTVPAAICLIACLFVGIMPTMAGAEQSDPLPASAENRSGHSYARPDPKPPA